ncbi:MAG TPA: HAD-IIB family hydrolase [Candidatus Xenobia bacterium]|jgi:hypothetical protein
MRFPFDLAAIDVDGTLLGPTQDVSPENEAAIRRLVASGVRVLLASGRWHDDIVPFHRHLGLSGPIISSQGAMIKHGETGRVTWRNPVPDATARELAQAALDCGLTVIAYRAGGVATNVRNAWSQREESVIRRSITVARSTDTLCRSVLKIICCGPAERLRALSIPADLTHLVGHPEWHEFYEPSSCKATALARVARTLGIPPHRVATFGDGDNDATMLRWAGLGVAMHHGTPGARQAARMVAPPGPPETCLSRAVAVL